MQDVVIDFDSHHIGLQQPQAQAHQETDTHLHDQPAPDVSSIHHTSTLAAPGSPVQSSSAQQQAAAPPLHASAAAESTTAPTRRQQQQTGIFEAPSSSTQHTTNQTNTAALSHRSSGKSAVPANAEQTQHQPSTSMHDASTQQLATTSDSMHPSPPAISQQPQAAQQRVVHARSETPSYTPSDVQHTGQPGVSQSEGMSVQTKQYQQEPEMYSAVSTPADSTARDSGHVDGTSGQQVEQAEQTGAGTELNARDSVVSADGEQGPAGTAAAAQSESQQADVTAATASRSQQEDDAQQSGANPAPKALLDVDQPPEPAAQSSSARAEQQEGQAERGAGFPAGPVGKTICSSSLHICCGFCNLLRGL